MAPPKTAAANPTGEEPPAKKAKGEEGDEPKKEEEKPFEEPDAAKDNRATIKETIVFEPSEMTLNAIPTMQGKLLMAISEGGMAYLMAGARASVAQKAGRYMFEAKIVQTMNPIQSNQRGSTPPRQMLRVGFSVAGSTLMLGDDDNSVCFDADGSFISEKKRHPGKAHIYRSTVVGVVLNLDPKSPNFNTVTLYCEGKKVSDPRPLPEGLKGKPLLPHVCYRNLSVNVNFGPVPMAELPFKCRMLQQAAQSDMVVSTSKEATDGKYEVVLPVAFPDEGTFDWLDAWLEKNPKFVELSDRKIMDWARCSGFWSRSDRKLSNDKPNFNFGVPALDDLSVRKLIGIVAPIVPRNYVVMEVKSNLVPGDRKDTLKKFTNPCYKKVAHVVMGEPDKDFKAMVQGKLLKEKQEKADGEWKVRKAEKDRKKAIETREKERKAAEKERAAARKKTEEEAKKKAEEEAEKKAKEEAAKKEEAEKKDEPKEGEEAAASVENKDGDEPKKEEEKEKAAEEKAEEKEEEKPEEEPEEKADEEEEDMETEPPAVELTEEEKATAFLQKRWPDLSPHVMSASFSKFAAPDKSEGFDDIRYEWDSAEKAGVYLKDWVTKKKMNTRIEDLKPGETFTTKAAEFAKLYQTWQDCAKSNESKAKPAKEKAEGDAEDEEELDVFKVEDIMNVGEGLPLFQSFGQEDWALMQLRSELHMLVTNFKKDCDDPERTGVPVDHVPFYYYKYFSKMFNPASFGMTENKDLLNLIKDTVTIKEAILSSQLEQDPENFDIFVKLTEAARRDRQRRIEAGDETARLRFVLLAPAPPPKDFLMGLDGGAGGERGAGAPQGRAFVPHRAPYDQGSKGKDFKGKGKGKGKYYK